MEGFKATTVTPPPDAEDEAPKRGRPAGSKNRTAKLEKELEDFFTTVGAGIMLVDSFDGLVIVSNASENAKALNKLAKKSPRVKVALERLVEVSTIGEVVTIVGATAIPIAMHHGFIPAQLPIEAMGYMVPPEREKLRKDAENDTAGKPPQTGSPPVN